MPSAAVHAFGTLLQMGDGGGPEVFTTVAEVRSITGPAFAGDTVEVTSHSSTGAFREHIANLLDMGDLTFDISFVPANATHNQTTGLLKKFLDRIRTNFKLVFPSSPTVTWSFQGFVTAFAMTAPIDNVLTAAVTIRVTGAPTFA